MNIGLRYQRLMMYCVQFQK